MKLVSVDRIACVMIHTNDRYTYHRLSVGLPSGYIYTTDICPFFLHLTVGIFFFREVRVKLLVT